MTSSGRDLSTLAALQPTQAEDLSFRSYKNSVRLHGSHRLTMRRPSRAPEASRKYIHGDPVNMIDWLAYARTDQLIIREKRDEATARIAIFLDVSETMQWPPFEPGDDFPQKWEVATRIALHLSYLHVRQGDIVHFYSMDQKPTDGLLPRFKPRSPSDVAGVYGRVAATEFEAPPTLSEGWAVDHYDSSFDVGYLISDGLGPWRPKELLKNCKSKAMFHLLSSKEDDINWIEAGTCYFDEGLHRKEYQGQDLLLRDNYQSSVQRWRSRLQEQLKDGGGFYFYVTDRTPLQRYWNMLHEFEKSA